MVMPDSNCFGYALQPQSILIGCTESATVEALSKGYKEFQIEIGFST